LAWALAFFMPGLDLLIYMITSAQRHVYSSPSFVLDATIAEALAAAALAGIKVHVMLTARASGDPVPGWASNTYVQDVVAAGVRVFLQMTYRIFRTNR
jgi:cardiolipin synthase